MRLLRTAPLIEAVSSAGGGRWREPQHAVDRREDAVLVALDRGQRRETDDLPDQRLIHRENHPSEREHAGHEVRTRQDAMDQAAQEIHDEALQAKLQYQVEQGLITQEEADAFSEWYESRPEGLDHGFGSRGIGRGGMSGGARGMKGHGMWFGNLGIDNTAPEATVTTGTY